MHDIVESVKIERRVEFMTLQEMIDEEKKDSYEEGVEQGRAEGITQGIEQGAAREKLAIAEKMRASGMSEDLISAIVG
jgi:flagellar biosynthesis/type III secretory pathway protein FliH